MNLAPLRNKDSSQLPWEGDIVVKPWEYQVTAVIPLLDTIEQIKICVELLRLQTIKPYIILIDTGSESSKYQELETLRSDDLEVHSIKLNAVMHPSDFPAMAMDLGFTLCRTEYLFATHADCFIRRKDFIEDLINLAKNDKPVVGYEISPRNHTDWHGMVSHTATIYHMPTMDKIGFGWSQRRLCNIFDIKDFKPSPMRPNWPDTEILGNYILRHAHIKPHLIGSEQNFARQKDDNIDHFRSFTSGNLYSPEYFERCNAWYQEAKVEALDRINLWKKEASDLNKSYNTSPVRNL